MPDETPPPADCCEVVITGPDGDWLAQFARRLVEARLAACGQVSASIRSVYRWQGRIHDEPEARVQLHTRMALVDSIVEQARIEHPYQVPCVIALPVLGGHPDYLAWIRYETDEPGR